MNSRCAESATKTESANKPIDRLTLMYRPGQIGKVEIYTPFFQQCHNYHRHISAVNLTRKQSTHSLRISTKSSITGEFSTELQGKIEARVGWKKYHAISIHSSQNGIPCHLRLEISRFGKYFPVKRYGDV